LVDSVYEHVLAWRQALEAVDIRLSVWRIHRKIGMSGGLFVNALSRETGRRLTEDEVARAQRLHREAFIRLATEVRPLPGALELTAALSQLGVPWAIATSGRLATAEATLKVLGIRPDIPVITRSGRACQAGPGSIPGGGQPAWGRDRLIDRGGR